MLEYPEELVAGQIFNAGYQNNTVTQLAETTKTVVEQEYGEKTPIRIETTQTNDSRSYHVSSRKIAERLGYLPERTIEGAVRDLCVAFKAGKFPDSMANDNYVNVKTVKRLALR